MLTVAPRAWLLIALGTHPEGASLLTQVDRLRHPWPAYAVEVTLDDGRALQRWRVRVRENGDARLEGLSPNEKGRNLWILGERFWLQLPGSRRILSVTPQQRLLGPASGSDVARVRFSESYTVEAVTPEAWEGRPALRLELRATQTRLTWRTARLWVTAEGRPLEGAFYLSSGKLARTIRFDAPVSVLGTRLIPGLTLRDPSGSETRLTFDHWTPGPQDPTHFEGPTALVEGARRP